MNEAGAILERDRASGASTNPRRFTTGIEVTNHGTITTTNGELTIDSAPGHYAGTTFSGGRWEVGAGTTLNLPSAIAVNDADFFLTGAGANVPDFTPFSNYLAANTGTLELMDGADLTTNGDFTNFGHLAVGNADTPNELSTLTVGGEFTNDSAATFTTRISGTQGTQRYGDVVSTGDSTLAGTFEIELLGGHVPDPGDQYRIVYAEPPSVRSGSFADPAIGNGALHFEVTESPNSVDLNGQALATPEVRIDPPLSTAEGDDAFFLDGVLDNPGSVPGATFEWTPDGLFENNTVEDPKYIATADDTPPEGVDVTLKVCHAGGAEPCTTATETIHVDNVAPDVTTIAGAQSLTQGDTLGPLDLASFTDAGVDDTHEVQIWWGDGSTDTIPDGAISPVNASHEYLKYVAPGSVIRVRVTDDDGGFAETEIPVEVANVAPVVTPGAPSFVEGNSATQTLATITDIGPESFSATVDWDTTDGAGPEAVLVNYAADPTEVYGGHAYPDNDTYDAELCVKDNTGAANEETCKPLTVTVTNAAPTIVLPATPIDVVVGDTAAVEGTYDDPADDAADTHTFMADWDGDGTDDETFGPFPYTDGTFSFDHQFDTVGPVTVRICVTDDDGGQACDTQQVDVAAVPNVAPTVLIADPIPASVDEGSPVTLDGTVTDDDDNLDPTTILWTGAGGTFSDAMAEDTTWTPLDEGSGSYTLRLSASDFLEAEGYADVTVDVLNVAPTIEPLVPPPSIDEGDSVTLMWTFSDPGVNDVHTATVDWDDGAGPVGVDVTETAGVAGGSISATHAYPQNGTYTAVLCLDDGDSPAVCSNTTVVVDNVAPQDVDAGPDQGGTTADDIELTTTFTDPGTQDAHTATIDWDGDGTPDETVDPAASGFTASHQYATAGIYPVEVCVTDGESPPVCDTVEVTIASDNTPPVADPGGPYPDALEGTPYPLDGSESADPDTDGTIVAWEWTAQDPAVVSITSDDTPTPTFEAKDDGEFAVDLRVQDNLGAWSPIVTATVMVANVAPAVDAGGPETIGVGDTFERTIDFTDLAELDTHTAMVDWDDGTGVESLGPVTSPSFDISHPFATAGDFTVEVCVTDDDHGTVGDGQHCPTFVVTVVDGPDAVDDTFTLSEGGGTATLDVLENDLDPADGGLTIIGKTDLDDPAAGSVVCGTDTCTMNVTAGFTGDVTFTYTIKDVDEVTDDPATVTVTVLACADLTGAFAEPLMSDGAPWSLVQGYAWEECAHPGAHATAGAELTPILAPDSDDTVALLTTGLASQADDSSDQDANEQHGREHQGASDASILRLDLDVPATIDVETEEGEVEQQAPRCLTFDVVFATEEYPEYTTGGTNPFNDGFIAELGSTGWSANESEITAPENFAFDPDGKVISVNSAFFDDGRVIEYADTGMIYDGASPVLRARTPIDPGAQPLYLSVFDGGDDGNDSGVIVDHFQLLATPCIGGLSQPPVAVDDDYTIDEDEPDPAKRLLELVANDYDLDGDDVTILRAPEQPIGPLQSEHGTVVPNDGRTHVRYNPDRDYWGTDTFDYTVTDVPNATGNEDVDGVSRGTVTITIDEINDAPIARRDYASTPPAPVTIPVLANDRDPDNHDLVLGNEDTISIVSNTTPIRGDATCSPTECIYTPDPGYDGPDLFRYTIEDGRGGSDSDVVFINFEFPTCEPGDPCNNLHPVADAGGPYDGTDCADPCAGIPLDGSGSYDPDGTIAEWTWLVEEPGTLTGADGPNPVFSSPDGGVFRVTLIVCDNHGACDADSTLVVDFQAEITSPVDEGSAARATVDFFNPGGDLAASIDWGDGGSDAADPAIFPVVKSHTYPQDGPFDVEMCISGSVLIDDTIEAIDVCDTTALLVNNVLPEVNAGVDRSLLPGGTLHQIRMFFRDPGDDADWTATVDWGDGSQVDGTAIEVDQGTKLLTMVTDHVYADRDTYTVTICVTDDHGEGCDDFEVTVSDFPPPVSDPGGPYEGTVEGQTIELDGSESYDLDGEIVSWAWSTTEPEVTLGEVDPADPEKKTFRAADDGVYTVSLEVCDEDDQCTSAEVEIPVANVAPTVDEIDDGAVAPGGELSVPVSFTDPGVADTHTATVDWGDGTAVEEFDPVTNPFDVAHVFPDVGIYPIEVCVTDDDGETGCAMFDVEAADTPGPIADPGGPYEADEGETIVLDGSGSFDPDGSIVSWEWMSPDPGPTLGDVDPVDPMKTTFKADDDGDYTVELTVCDDDAQCDTEPVVIPVANVAPAVDPIDDQTAVTGDTVTVEVSFTDPGVLDTHTAEVDWDGDGLADETVDPATSPFHITHVFAEAGTYIVKVCVTDDDEDTGCAMFAVGVSDTPPPTVIPGGPYAADEGETIELDGGASFDPDGSIVSWEWSTLEPGVTVVDEDLTDAVASFTGADDGTYTVSLEVCDDDGQCATESVEIPVANVAPTVDPIGDRTAETGQTVSVPVIFTDPGVLDTHEVTVDWGEGAGAEDLGPVTSPFHITHTYAAEASHTVEVCVTDDDGDTGCEAFEVHVSDTPHPTPDTGWPYAADEGETIGLDGGGSFDPDGTIVSWTWSTDELGVTVTDADTSDATASFVADDDGEYTVSLEVCDDDGQCAAADVVIPVSNVAPTVGPIADRISLTGEELVVAVTFSDSGVADTHTATADWGDGSPLDPVDPATSPFDIAHTYASEGTYAVAVCVTDDDGDTDCVNFDVDVFDLPPTPELSIDDVTQAEGDTPDTTDFEFTVSLDQPGFGDVSFEYATVDIGEATEGVDYESGSGPMVIPAGEVAVAVPVTVIGDRLDEPDERFQVIITEVNDAEVTDDTGVGTILDDGDRCTIEGTPGDDTLEGTVGPDIICADAGNDLIVATPGADEYLGEEGIDTVDYRQATSSGITVNLAAGATSGWATHDLSSIENATGGPSVDLLAGDAGPNVLDGAGDDDIIRASGGGDDLRGGQGDKDRISYATIPDAASGVGIGVWVNIGSSSSPGSGFGLLRGTSGTRWDRWDRLTSFEHVYGSPFDDLIDADGRANSIWGSGGADLIYAREGNDAVFGGDEGTGGTPDKGDVIFLGQGQDLAQGQGGSDAIWGEDGEDTIAGDLGTGVAGNGSDLIFGGGDRDTLDGDGGVDTIRGGNGNDIIRGGNGADRLYGDDDEDTIHGEGGADYIEGNSGADVLAGDNGHDTMLGNGGNDTLRGGNGEDKQWGGNGNDTMFGDARTDRLNGGNDWDILVGGPGPDVLNGDAGRDTLKGGDGGDVLQGGADADTLKGQKGQDYLYGYWVFGTDGVRDTLNGGPNNKDLCRDPESPASELKNCEL